MIKRVLRGAVFLMGFVLLLPIITGCSGKEGVYQGLYEGVTASDQHRKTQDPSYDPVRAQEQDQPSYQEYKKEREQILNKDGSIGANPAAE